MEPCFKLRGNTEILFHFQPDKVTTSAVEIFRRDLKNTRCETQADTSFIHIEEDRNLAAEGWTIESTGDAVRVSCADSLGCMYALLFISEKFLGVAPFWYWNDQPLIKSEYAEIPPGVWHSPHYAVRFRGWFVNDEVLIENWGGNNLEHWRMVFEALLRLGGNMVIPGTDDNSRKYRALASEMGLWLTHHHSEPLGAEMFARVYPDVKASYAQSSGLYEDLWRKAVTEQSRYKVVWGLGFRGQGDRPFWNDDPAFAENEARAELINRAIQKQYEIVRQTDPSAVCCINIYGEMAELYHAGLLNLPPGVIKIWADNGYGKMVSRRQWNHNPRVYSLPEAADSGPHGVYYHCSFHDLQASNHLTMSPNPMELIASELRAVLDSGADEYWIINCGSLKPHLHSLDLVCRMWLNGQTDTAEWRKSYVGLYYGTENRESVAALFAEYASCTAKFGPREDERAGEQIWHHPVRELLCRWMSGNVKDPVESLIWLAGNVPFAEQAEKLNQISLECLPKMTALLDKCESIREQLGKDARKLFDESLYLHVLLQVSGCAGTNAFCEGVRAFVNGDIALAFYHICRAKAAYARGTQAVKSTEAGKWKGFYDGDCLTDIRLTGLCINALAAYLRVIGDGTTFHQWEKNYLMAAGEKNIELLSSKTRALSDAEMYAALCEHLNKEEK